MKIKSLLLFALIVFSYNISIAQSAHLVTIGEPERLYSKILKEERNIWVQVPESANATTNHPNTYPVVYVLDGGEHFMSVCTVINQLSPGSVPEMIVVGIETSENRTRDLTPTKVKEARGSSAWVKESGGGERFTNFMVEELIPYIDNTYPTASHKTFVGHSFGGLLVVNTLINHPEVFNNYIAIDPSLWWDDEVLTNDVTDKLSSETYTNKSLYISISNPLPPDTEKDLEALIKDQSMNTEGLRALHRFSTTISEAGKSPLNFKYKYYENEDHGTIPLISIYDGMRFLYPWYKMSGKLVDVIQNPDTSTEALKKAFDTRFDMLSNKLGYQVSPEEEMLNNLGSMFMSNSPEKSLGFLEMAIEYYPNNANGYEGMSDYYESQNDIKNAIVYAEKAFAISGSEDHKSKLEKLKNE
ncbi:alpha/beta hydrolase-fold protein [Psychroserpens sp. Hel_I_66]|uniref:alpha/beta hydrolase-fold protein n=1 Tax=Psychroserpens sp. Hel_I_66 TaxID=1250004 RepID=UPI00064644D6|nr:alpha/beta hydrolase-fold protein [Psychroserpens sp. Hel_I_66]